MILFSTLIKINYWLFPAEGSVFYTIKCVHVNFILVTKLLKMFNVIYILVMLQAHPLLTKTI